MGGELAFPGLSDAVPYLLVDEHWAAFDRSGFLDLGPALLVEEAGDIVDRYGPLAGTDFCDRVAESEFRPLFELMHHPLMYEVCARIYGPRAPVMVFAGELLDTGQSASGWRQNAARLADLDRDEVVTVLVGLTEAPDCVTVDVVEGSHRLGLLDANYGLAPDSRRDSQFAQHGRAIVIQPGHALLLHKWVVNRLAPPATGSSCLLAALWFGDGRSRNVHTGYPHHPFLIGAVDQMPYPCVDTLNRACAAEHDQFERAQAYAVSLERQRDELQTELSRLRGAR